MFPAGGVASSPRSVLPTQAPLPRGPENHLSDCRGGPLCGFDTLTSCVTWDQALTSHELFCHLSNGNAPSHAPWYLRVCPCDLWISVHLRGSNTSRVLTHPAWRGALGLSPEGSLYTALLWLCCMGRNPSPQLSQPVRPVPGPGGGLPRG